MGKYDEIPPDQLRAALVRFANLILEMERDDRLLGSSPELLKLMGDLRQMLFAWEVRCTRERKAGGEEGDPSGVEVDEGEDSTLRRSLRIVEEAIRRQENFYDEISGEPNSDEDEE